MTGGVGRAHQAAAGVPGGRPGGADGAHEAGIAGGPPESPRTPWPRRAYLVSHTHWDREWYRTFHDFRVSLVDVVGRVLAALEAGGPFRRFLLDGQSVIIEDYLAVVPEDRGRIAALVRSGALAVGPWYVLPDNFLIGQEAQVRNLLYGHAAAAELGGAQKVGYMPDSFGHPAQMPQLLRKAGIDSFIYTRGDGDDIDGTGLEYRWRAPDGSEVTTAHQWRGYCNAAALGLEEIWHAHTRRTVDLAEAVRKVGALLREMAERSNVDVALLNNGCDHLPPQQEFTRVLDALREAFPSTEFVHASPAEYMAAVGDSAAGVPRALPVRAGELRHGKLHHILTGVWSARMYLKQRNHDAQEALVWGAEPIASYAHFMYGRPYPPGLLDDAWKLLLRNHPHDSICGCSIDKVHREMLPRFSGVIDTAERIVADRLGALAPTFARAAEDDGATILAVMNPLPWRRSAVVERLVVLQPPGFDPRRLTLVDDGGRPVPFEVVERWTVERFWGVDYRTMLRSEEQLERFENYRAAFGSRIVRPASEADREDTFLHIRFLAEDLPGVGHRTYYLRKSKGAPSAVGEGSTSAAAEGTSAVGLRPDEVRVSGHTVENRWLRATLNPDGTFDLEDLATGHAFTGLGALLDVEDAGDEYDYAPAPESSKVTSAGIAGTVRVVADGPLRGALEARFDLDLPAALAVGRNRRSRRAVRCATRVGIGLDAGARHLDLRVRFDNRVRDHRLRIAFPTGLRVADVVSDGNFHLDRRPVEPPPADGWVQPPADSHPQQEYTLVQDGGVGLAVFAAGLPEVAPRRGADGAVTLDVTLLRAVGWLSRDDLATRRRQNAGPTVPTPEAQCPGAHTFRLALTPFAADAVDAGLPRLSREWRRPPYVVQGVADGHAPGGDGLLEFEGAGVAVSAVKRHAKRNTLVVRLYGFTGARAATVLRFGPAVARAWRTDLLEERIEEIPASARRIEMAVEPYEIVTLEVLFR